MFHNSYFLALSLTILVAGTASGLPQGGWFSGGVFGRRTETAKTNVITTTTVPPPHNVGILVTDLKQNAGNVVSQLNEMKGEGMKVLSETKEKVSDIVESLKSVASGDSIRQITGDIALRREKLANIGKEIQSFLQNRVGKPISEQLKIISEKIGQISGELGSAVAGASGGQVMGDIGQHIGKAVDEINKVISGESVQKIITAVNTISGKLNQAVDNIGSTVLGKGNKPMGQYIGDVGKSVGNAMSEVASLVGGENGKKLVGELGAQVDNAVLQVNSIVKENPVGKLTSMASKISGEVGQATGELKTFVQNANFKDAVDIIKSNDKAVELATNFGSGLVSKYFG